MHSDNKIKFANKETVLKLLSSKNRARKFKDYKERKQAVSKYLWKNLKFVGFKLFLSSFINLFAHSNPQESKTQILTESLHRALFLVLHVLLKALCSELQGYVSSQNQTWCSSLHWLVTASNTSKRHCTAGAKALNKITSFNTPPP